MFGVKCRVIYLFYSEEEMDDYIELQRNKLLVLAKVATNGTADMCRWNYATRKCGYFV